MLSLQRKFALIVASALGLASWVSAQSMPPENKQFDFWVGDWIANGTTKTKDGKTTPTKGSNRIRRVMSNYAVQENFKMGSYEGSSWSVYDAGHKAWKQTWVDNGGGYIDLSGHFEDGKMTLQTVADPSNPAASNRMIYYNITNAAFDWDWEGTRDGGKTWKLLWHLHYTRK